MAVAVIHECDAAGQRARFADGRSGIARGEDENYVWRAHSHRIATGGAKVEGRRLFHSQREALRGRCADPVTRCDGDGVAVARTRSWRTG